MSGRGSTREPKAGSWNGWRGGVHPVDPRGPREHPDPLRPRAGPVHRAAAVATPSSFVVTAMTITTATTTTYLLQANQAWRWLKLLLSANTNVTLTATAFV